MWDHWLLDTLSSWERQPDGQYAVPSNELDATDEEAATQGGRSAEAQVAAGAVHSILSDVSRQLVTGSGDAAAPPACKRPRVDQEQEQRTQNLPHLQQPWGDGGAGAWPARSGGF